MYPSSSGSSGDEAELGSDKQSWRNSSGCKQSKKNTMRNAAGKPNRREDTGFSMKQFLKNDSHSNQYAGARPKVYEPQSARISQQSESSEQKYPRNPTELPDFVQDHLVIEQCYLNDNNPVNVAVDNLPDFALNSAGKRHNHSDYADVDLSKLRFLDDEPADVLDKLVNNFPEPESIPKRLPDFLSDAPICSRSTAMSDRSNYSDRSGLNVNESMNTWQSAEIERLRNELQIAKRQVELRSLRIEELETELISNISGNSNLEAMQKGLKTREQKASEREILLRKQIDDLSIEMAKLRAENKELKGILGIESNGLRCPNADNRVQRLAEDLRHAASNAEVSLQQLMSGVNNLRVLASALENVDKIQDRTKDFLPDFDEDNAAGPAL